MRHKGEVTGVRQHSNGKHVVVDIAHGPRAKPKRASKTNPFPSSYDDRPSSSIVMPKAQAGRFPVGRTVNVGMTAQPDGDGDMGEDLDQMDARLRKARKR